ncbi:MAG: hypothetical protein HWN69_09130 [Desulfobacterales bacterium]|nr:hypothetical protein [Desulfobacterales bacterium]
MTKKQIKNHLESLGERVGDQVAQGLSKGAENKGGKIGRKVGKVVGEQAERLHDALEKETVTKEEQLGIGGKIGTGLGIIGKRLVEKRYGFLGRLMGGDDLVSEGRVIGAKAEKIVKRTVKKGVQRIGRGKGESNKS